MHCASDITKIVLSGKIVPQKRTFCARSIWAPRSPEPALAVVAPKHIVRGVVVSALAHLGVDAAVASWARFQVTVVDAISPGPLVDFTLAVERSDRPKTPVAHVTSVTSPFLPGYFFFTIPDGFRDMPSPCGEVRVGRSSELSDVCNGSMCRNPIEGGAIRRAGSRRKAPARCAPRSQVRLYDRQVPSSRR